MKRNGDHKELDVLDARLRILLPEPYQDRYEDIQPVSMGSAGLKYGGDGKVAWDQIWGSFCDLAMAGGPPHRGTLLEPGDEAAIGAQAEPYQQVLNEMGRGITMVTGLFARPAAKPGWVRIDCMSAAMAAWLVRAIVMENVAAHSRGLALYLPAGPHYRLAKEIKNVVTVLAKTCHYWFEHTSEERQQAIADLLRTMERESPLLQPALIDHQPHAQQLAELIVRETKLTRSDHRYAGWLGLLCADVRSAIWMMRALVVSNVLSRREGIAVFVPINPETDPGGEAAVRAVLRACRFASLHRDAS